MAVRITYFVHGTTTDNETGIATGCNPGELSELGKKQSIELKDQIKGKEFDVIFCSDLKRSIDSAKMTFEGSVEIIQDIRIRECDYGDWNGKKKDWELKDFIDKRYPNGESYKDVEKRIRSFLDFLKEKYDGKHIAIVAHQAPQLAIEVILQNKTWEESLENDWRKRKAWQPGWDYIVE